MSLLPTSTITAYAQTTTTVSFAQTFTAIVTRDATTITNTRTSVSSHPTKHAVAVESVKYNVVVEMPLTCENLYQHTGALFTRVEFDHLSPNPDIAGIGVCILPTWRYGLVEANLRSDFAGFLDYGLCCCASRRSSLRWRILAWTPSATRRQISLLGKQS